MQSEQPLPPIKATAPGRGGRKHTLATLRLSEVGKVEIHLLCTKPGCGCSGWYVLEDLIENYGQLTEQREKEKEKEAA